MPTLGPSPVQQLIENDMGLVMFYHLLQDCRSEMETLLEVIHQARQQEYVTVARVTPAEGLIAVENTSSTLISPKLYRRYTLGHIRDYAGIAHQHGKKLILHMCGLVKNLLPAVGETGMDAINGLTPPAVGDCTVEDALSALGEHLVLLGAILDPTVLHHTGLTKEELWRTLDALYTPRVRQAHVLLWLGVDGLPTPLWKFCAVKEWMEQQLSIGD